MRIHPARLTAGIAVVTIAGVLGVSCGGGEKHAGAESPPVIDTGDGGDYHASLDADEVVDVIDNPYLPLRPGSRWVYEGEEGGETERIEVTVTDERREIMGISAVVVRDTVTVDGEVIEDTFDWYTQDTDGNVWYLGEDTKEYEDGKVSSTEGSWEAGVDDAQPGIAMPAHPQKGDAYRQEYDPGNAEDLAEVKHVGGRSRIELGSYDDVVLTQEWTPLEPEVVEEKTYAPGVGLILEVVKRGGKGRTELVEFSS